MCGISGFYNQKQGFDKLKQLKIIEDMLNLLIHRGPDEYGVYQNSNIAMGHTRLSILDISHGQQPMFSYNGNCVITYNGEVFNYKEIREELSAKGIKFKTNCDTEVVVNAYECLGIDCLKKFNGQFAFAIYDKKNQSLFLARDNFGILPLFYFLKDGLFVFSSEIKSIFAYPDMAREISPAGIYQALSYWGVIGKSTCFKDINQLEPGTYLKINLRSFDISCEKYWDLNYSGYNPARNLMSENEIAGNLKSLIKQSVNIRLHADVPVGCYLSGGLDSSIIAREIYETGNDKIKSFSVAFESKNHDESEFQNIFFKANPFDNHVLRIKNEDINNVFEDVVWHGESLLFRTAPAPMFLLSRDVNASNVKVILTGEGADEVFYGYDIFKELKIRNFWKKNIKSAWRFLLIKELFPQYEHFKDDFISMQKMFYLDSLNYPFENFFSHSIRVKNNQSMLRFLSVPFRESIKDFSPEAELNKIIPKDFSKWNSLERCQYLEMKTLLQGYLLSSQGDRMAMSHSVELRFPYLDKEVINYSLQIPGHLKMRVLREKNILKKAYKDVLPEQIINRHKHAYQAPDLRSFVGNNVKNDKINYYTSRKLLEEAGIWNPDYIEKLLSKYSDSSINAISFRDNMAVVAIISSMILYDLFIKGSAYKNKADKKIVFSTRISE
ncbi:MAG: hypothetical protein ACD_79C00912G0002 [uncultured bacterium]|nr:MAG: hypothetical protein ACD_79C00912G0002 [uncultured bacterium]